MDIQFEMRENVFLKNIETTTTYILKNPSL
jgi:hypothetical protein